MPTKASVQFKKPGLPYLMKVAWISTFPIEWLNDIPQSLTLLPPEHPSTWQRVLLSEMEKDTSLDLNVVVLRKHFERSSSFVRNGVTFHLVKTMGWTRAPSMFWTDTLLIRRLLDRIQPDVVHAWGAEKGAALVASRLDFPSITTIQGLLSWMSSLFPLTPYEQLTAWLEKVSLARPALVTAESTFCADYIRHHFPALTVKQIDVVPDRIFHKVIRNPQLDPFKIVFIANLGIRKGGDILIRALDQLIKTTSLELVVIGDILPQFLQELQAVTSPEIWKRVKFKPGLHTSQVAEELASAAIMVCPTRADTGPMAVKEAVVTGVPVVGSKIGGLTDYVVPNKNGILFAPGNWVECLTALRAAVEHPQFGRGLVDAETLLVKRAALSPARMKAQFVEAYRHAKDRFRRMRNTRC